MVNKKNSFKQAASVADRVSMPIGVSSFEEIRGNGTYYVDKTEIVKDLINSKVNVTLFTRPRRFGKTLTMSMLKSFFDITGDSRALFDGLEISENTEICNDYMNQYPTIFLTLKEVQGAEFDTALRQLQNKIYLLCKKFLFLLDSNNLDEDDKKIFTRLKSGEADKIEIMNSLDTLVRLLYVHYGKPVILLIDEYNVPLAKASDNGYYNEMLDVMRGFMQVLKDNSCLKFAVITGCLRISKESIFTGTNNFYVNSITSSHFNGNSNFAEIRKEDLYYVDKTGFIFELLNSTEKVRLITRPRRFGKTLMMSMLENFFNVEKNSKELFKDLEISNYSNLYDTYIMV